MNRILSFFLAVVAFITALFSGKKEEPYFKNNYDLPDTAVPYRQLDTTPKTDWWAQFIWDSSDGSEENVRKRRTDPAGGSEGQGQKRSPCCDRQKETAGQDPCGRNFRFRDMKLLYLIR